MYTPTWLVAYLELRLGPHGRDLLHHLLQHPLLHRGGRDARDLLVECRHLLVDQLSQGDLRLSLDLEPDHLVDLVPMSGLQALVAEVDHHWKDGAEVVHVILFLFLFGVKAKK